MMFDCPSAARGAGCHSAAGTKDVVGSGCSSTNWTVPGISIDSLVVDWCADKCYFKRPVPEASSSWLPSPCACYQSQ